MAVVARRLTFALVVALWWPAAALAQDEPSAPVRYEGTWVRSGQSISVDVSSWGADCGPRPQSSSGGGSGRVSIRQADRELVLSGGVRTERSDGCWSMNPRVRRVSHSQSEGRWRTTCRTPADDPKFEEGTYTLRATSPDAIVYRESSRYDWRLQADHCIATITLSWSYSRVGAAPPPVANTDEPPPPAPTPPPPVRCASPGEPARVLLDAARRRIEAGEQVCLRPRVVDASGCETTATAELQSPDATLTGNCFEVPVDAPDGQRFRVRATSGSLHAEATLVVQSPDIMGYLAARTEDGSGAPAAGQAGPASAPQAGGLSAEPARPREDPILWLVLVIAAVALLILGVAFVLFRNQRRQPQRSPSTRAAAGPPRPAAVPATSPATAHLVCPTCHAEFEEGQFCPHDASRLAETVDEGRPGAVCPKCHRGFDPTVRFCPHDSEELVPYTMHEAMAPRAHRHRGEKGKICPACAARYEIDATFCGKDGSELVLVN